MENMKINPSTHKTQMKAGASRAGRRSIVKSPRIIYTRAANEYLAKVFDPRNDCATNKCIITALPLVPQPLRLTASPLIIERHIPVEMKQAVSQSSARSQECDHTAAAAHFIKPLLHCCQSQLLVKSYFSTVKHSWTFFIYLYLTVQEV